MNWWWDVQHVIDLSWVVPACCDHAGEEGHEGQEDGEVLHFCWLGLLSGWLS